MDRYHSLDNDPAPLPAAQDAKRDELERLTQQFIAQGGTITSPVQLPVNQGYNYNKSSRSKAK